MSSTLSGTCTHCRMGPSQPSPTRCCRRAPSTTRHRSRTTRAGTAFPWCGLINWTTAAQGGSCPSARQAPAEQGPVRGVLHHQEHGGGSKFPDRCPEVTHQRPQLPHRDKPAQPLHPLYFCILGPAANWLYSVLRSWTRMWSSRCYAKPATKVEAAYRRADKAIGHIIELLAA